MFLTAASGRVCRNAASTASAARTCPAPTDADMIRIRGGMLEWPVVSDSGQWPITYTMGWPLTTGHWPLLLPGRIFKSNLAVLIQGLAHEAEHAGFQAWSQNRGMPQGAIGFIGLGHNPVQHPVLHVPAIVLNAAENADLVIIVEVGRENADADLVAEGPEHKRA